MSLTKSMENMSDKKLPLDYETHPQWDNRNYVDLHTIYGEKELKSDTYNINSIILSESEVKFAKMRDLMDGQSWMSRGLKSNFPYIRLIDKNGGIMMSDTPMERNTNRNFVQKANGDVLIFGLGLGLIILPLLKADGVKSITVVEIHQDLIDIVKPILTKYDTHNLLNIVQGDCFEYHEKVPKNKKWDCIYGDIWQQISADNYDEMKQLTKNFKYRVNRKNKKSFIDHWMKDRCKRDYHTDDWW